jgi:hypothetical protein
MDVYSGDSCAVNEYVLEFYLQSLKLKMKILISHVIYSTSRLECSECVCLRLATQDVNDILGLQINLQQMKG